MRVTEGNRKRMNDGVIHSVRYILVLMDIVATGMHTYRHKGLRWLADGQFSGLYLQGKSSLIHSHWGTVKLHVSEQRTNQEPRLGVHVRAIGPTTLAEVKIEWNVGNIAQEMDISMCIYSIRISLKRSEITLLIVRPWFHLWLEEQLVWRANRSHFEKQ